MAVVGGDEVIASGGGWSQVVGSSGVRWLVVVTGGRRR